ncbi:MAG: DUF2125 domain-containing protein [Salinarimonas sp.]|nr:DUF2125 domain-containing protein [Salinarimonas sp.]
MSRQDDSSPDQQDPSPVQGDPPKRRRGGRFWLFAPYVLLVTVIVVWSVGWFFVRDRVDSEIEIRLAREADLGRNWDCADRRVGGFPFRIDISCASLIFTRADGATFSLGPTRALAQVYQPRHVIVEAAGPFRGTDGIASFEGDWESLRMSVRELGRGTEQFALDLRAPEISVQGMAPAPVEASAERFELYLRPAPDLAAAEGAVDMVMRATDARAPALDRLVGDDRPAQVEIGARTTNLRNLRTGAPRQMAQSWRDAGGTMTLDMIDIRKGDAHVQIAGELRLDDALRPQGRIEPSAAGIEDLVGRLLGGGGQQANAMMMLDALAPREEATTGPEGLRRFPALDLRDGRVFMGPIPIPQVRLQPVF